jgi:hypothetical protein
MCALIVTLAQYGSPAAYKDKLTLKAETESPLQIARSPIIIPLPGGSIIGLDLGRNNASLGISGVVDYALSELFIDGAAGTFLVGDIVKTTPASEVAWNAGASPVRAATPYATVVGIGYTGANQTSLFVSGVYATGSSPATESFFVDNEPITATTGSGATAVVNCPFPTKRRLEHVARYWYTSGQMTLTTRSNSYVGYIAGMEFNMAAGYEDRYTFRISFAEATQGLT